VCRQQILAVWRWFLSGEERERREGCVATREGLREAVAARVRAGCGRHGRLFPGKKGAVGEDDTDGWGRGVRLTRGLHSSGEEGMRGLPF
jgi:hypothetical protein